MLTAVIVDFEYICQLGTISSRFCLLSLVSGIEWLKLSTMNCSVYKIETQP